jgi:predicted MPP superfamily phosphohydrolase
MNVFWGKTTRVGHSLPGQNFTPMTSRGIFGFLVFTAILVLIDIYAWKGISTALGGVGPGTRRWVRWIYWAESIGMIALLVWVSISIQDLRANRNYAFVFSLAALLILFLLPKLVLVIFHGIEDLLQGLRWIWYKAAPGANADGEPISRIRFISQVGLALAAIPFGAVLYGVTKGRRDFRVHRETIRSAKLPAAFDGLRIVQISDMHLGSFPLSSDIVRIGVDLINEQEPDLILFTGDLVNDFSEEAEPWLDTLALLKAKLGKYSILGNHDYSDYASWSDAKAKCENLDRLMDHHRRIGFRLLLDEHLPIEKDGEQFTLIGVQNWGVRFQQYGDLKKAVAGTDKSQFRLLMSHDPTHWEAQVQEAGIDLTLSGHTHGAQFGITIAGQTYSPAQWVYKQWAGHYVQDDMHLYVNRGFGFIGFPGRVGMPPEITVLELQRMV